MELDELVDDYLHATVEDLESCEQYIMAAERGEDPDHNLKQLKRIVHSLKGSAGSFGFREVTNICHSMEDFLSGSAQDDFFEKLLKYCDVLKRCLNSFDSQSTHTLNNIKQELINLEVSDSQTSHKTLIIDTSSTMRRINRVALEKAGVRVSESNNGYIALGRLLDEEFDSFITSQETGVVDGVNLIKCIDILLAKRNIPSVLISSTKMNSIQNELKNTTFVEKSSKVQQELSNIYKILLSKRSPPSATPTPGGRPLKKIVHVDDDQLMRRLIQGGLHKIKDLELVSCANAEEGLKAIVDGKPDLVILDVMMQGMSGTEMIEEMKKKDLLKDHPVLFVTGMTEDDEIKELQSLGCLGIITKPIRPSTLADRVLEIWAKAAAVAST